MLSKIRHYVAIKTLKSIYHVIFESYQASSYEVCDRTYTPPHMPKFT